MRNSVYRNLMRNATKQLLLVASSYSISYFSLSNTRSLSLFPAFSFNFSLSLSQVFCRIIPSCSTLFIALCPFIFHIFFLTIQFLFSLSFSLCFYHFSLFLSFLSLSDFLTIFILQLLHEFSFILFSLYLHLLLIGFCRCYSFFFISNFFSYITCFSFFPFFYSFM